MKNINNLIRNFSNKYKILSPPLKASLWFVIANIMQKGISIITVPIFTRLLTTEQYGVFSVFQSWYSIITIFATLNLSDGVFNNGMIKYEKDKAGFTTSLQTLSSFVTTILFVLYIINIEFWNRVTGLSTLYISIMFLELFFIPAYSFWCAKNKFEYKYKGIIICTLIIALGSPLLGVVSVISTSYKAEARVISFVLVQTCIGVIFYIFNVLKSNKFINIQYWKFALGFNIPLVPHYLSMTILQQADRIMIGSMIGKDKAAIYSVAYSVSMLMTLVTSAINNSFIPFTYRSLKNGEYEKIKKYSKFLMLAVGILCLGLMAFGPEVISIFATKEYKEAIWIIPPVALSVYFLFMYPLFSNIEFYFEENKFVSFASIIGSVLNIFLNYFALKWLGYLAAGYTTLICYILFAISHYIFMNKIIKRNLKGIKIYDIKFILSWSLILLLLMLIMSILYKVTILRYCLIMLFIIILYLNKKRIVKELKESINN